MEASCGVLQIEIEKNEQIEIQDLFFKIVSKKMISKNLQCATLLPSIKKLHNFPCKQFFASEVNYPMQSHG